MHCSPVSSPTAKNDIIIIVTNFNKLQSHTHKHWSQSAADQQLCLQVNRNVQSI